LYLTIIIAGIVCAIIIPRIPPTSLVPDNYYTENSYTEDVPKNVNKLKWALQQAVKRGETAGSLKSQIKEGFDIFAGISFTLIPQVMAIRSEERRVGKECGESCTRSRDNVK